MDDHFKELVRTYILLHDEITASSKTLRDLRRKKDDIGDNILVTMRNAGIDECALQDGKLTRHTSRRVASLSKDHIKDELRNALGGDETKVADVMTNMYNKRAVEVKESLKRTVNKS